MRWCKSQQINQSTRYFAHGSSAAKQHSAMLSSSFRPPIVHSFLKARLARSTRSLLFFSTVLPCWLWKADCEQKSHIQHFKVGTTTIWFDNNHDIKNTKKKSVGQCWVTVHCSLGAAPAFVVALPDAEQLTSPGGQLCSRSTSEEKDDKSHGII